MSHAHGGASMTASLDSEVDACNFSCYTLPRASYYVGQYLSTTDHGLHICTRYLSMCSCYVMQPAKLLFTNQFESAKA